MSKFVLIAAVLLAPISPLQTAGDDLSVEEILRTQITSVGRKAQQVAKAPAVVYVITQEDIRRSGATNIPDLLRMVPGLVVARINGSTWAISARGDARQYSNKMLVLIDGRSVYGRLFSGVFWNAQDVLLEDIDRIEVIRGTGAVMHITLALPRTRTMLDQNSSFNRPFACSTRYVHGTERLRHSPGATIYGVSLPLVAAFHWLQFAWNPAR